MSSRRAHRVGEQVQQEVASLLLTEVKDPLLDAVNITGIKMSPDLQFARLYYCVNDEVDPGDVEQALQRAQGFLRRAVGQRLRLRRVPALLFERDESAAYGRRMDALLSELRERGEMGADEE